MTDQWHRWRQAIATGTRVEWERGDVASGYYKRDTGRGASKPIEAICIYRDGDGKLQCIRDVYGDGSRMDADQIEELFASCCLFPISEEVYRAVEDGQPWPAEYATRLTMKDQQAGVAWTPEYGRKRLGADAKSDQPPAFGSAAENPRAVIGDNNPPEETPPAGHKIEGEQTPDKALFAKISETAATVKRWLAEIGGAPRNKTEADKIADYATVFGDMAKSADKARADEKKPHLDAGREIDAKWKTPIGAAEAARKAALSHVDRWLKAENDRRDAQARKEREEAAKAASKSGVLGDNAPATPVERINSVGNMRSVSGRSRTVWIVADVRAYVEHLLSAPGELPAEIVEAAGNVAQRRAEAAPGVIKEERRSAA